MWDKSAEIVNNDEIEINLFTLLHDVWKEFKRRAAIILVLAVLVGAACYLVSGMRYTPYYTANASFSVSKATGAKYKTAYEQNMVANKMGEQFPMFLTSDALKSLVMKDMGYARESDFNVSISSDGVVGANVVSLRVSAGDPQLAYDALESVLRNYSYVTEPAIGKVELKMLSESGVPARPSNGSSGKKMAVIGVLLTLIAAVLCLAVRCITGKTIRTGEEIPGALSTELLGTIPATRGKGFSGRGSEARAVTADTEGASPELIGAMRTIRHRVETATAENDAHTILITSALSGEGKTTAAADLATSLADQQYKVLLVDGNLRNPSILPALGMNPADKGLADVLSGRCEAETAMIPYAGGSNLTLLPGGSLNGASGGAQSAVPATLWSSPAAEQLFRNLKDRYDYILIDAPAAAAVSESGLIARFADGCIYVVQEARAEIGTLRKGMAAVIGAGCKILGSIFIAQ